MADENKEIVETNEVHEQENEEINNDEPSKTGLLTEADVTRAGLGKGFIGKPKEILLDVYAEQNKKFTQMSQTVSQIQKELQDARGNKHQTAEEKKEEKEAIEDLILKNLPPMPDSITDQQDFEKWVKGAFKTVIKEVSGLSTKQLQEALKNQVNPDAVNSLIEERNGNLLVTSLEKQFQELYKDDYDEKAIETAMSDYEKYLEGLPEKQRKILFDAFQGDPAGIADQIMIYHKSQNFGKEKKPDDDKQHDKIVEKTKNKSTSKNFTNTAISQRSKLDTRDQNSPYQKLIKEGEVNLKREDAK